MVRVASESMYIAPPVKAEHEVKAQNSRVTLALFSIKIPPPEMVPVRVPR